MTNIIHEISPDIDWGKLGKVQLMFCEKCGTKTRHSTPFYGYPFQCVVNHGGATKCDGCNTYVIDIAKVVVDAECKGKCYCTLCASPDSPQKQQRVEERRQKAAEAAKKPLDLDDPVSIARFFGASSFNKIR